MPRMLAVTVLPCAPYSQPSGPHCSELASAWASSRPKPDEQNLGIAVGHVVAVAIGIEEQIRSLHDEHAAVPQRQARRQVQAVNEIFGRVGVAVAVGIFQDRDPVGAARPARAEARARGRTSCADTGRLSPRSVRPAWDIADIE